MRRKFRVAFVIFGDIEIGGAEIRFANLFNHLTKNQSDYEFYFFLSEKKYNSILKKNPLFENKNIIVFNKRQRPEDNNLAKKKQIKTIVGLPNSVRRVKPLKQLKRLIGQWQILLNNSYLLIRAIRKYKINLVHTVWMGSFTTAFIKLFNKDFYHVVTYMDVYGDRLSNSLFQVPMSYWLSLKTADHIDFLGNSYLDIVRKSGCKINNEKITFSPCSFTNYNLYNTEKEIIKQNIVLFAARFDKRKNPFLFIDVAELVLKKRDDIHFAMLGNGYLEPEIIEYIENKNLTEIIDVRYSNDMKQEFKKSKIFLSLQEIDNYPSQAILEAMYLKNVVIATNAGDTKKLVTKEVGFLVDYSSNEIANKIEYLIDNNDIYEELANNAHDFVKKHHNIEIFSQYILSIYNKFRNGSE